MHYAVDVFIPCCGEPLQVIRTTVRAASQIRWSGLLVLYVLDDKNLPEVRQVAEMFAEEPLGHEVELTLERRAVVGIERRRGPQSPDLDVRERGERLAI